MKTINRSKNKDSLVLKSNRTNKSNNNSSKKNSLKKKSRESSRDSS